MEKPGPPSSGPLTRVLAADIEGAVVKSVNEHLRGQGGTPNPSVPSRDSIAQLIELVRVIKHEAVPRLRQLETTAEATGREASFFERALESQPLSRAPLRMCARSANSFPHTQPDSRRRSALGSI
jgi:hypothetical protein